MLVVRLTGRSCLIELTSPDPFFVGCEFAKSYARKRGKGTEGE